MVEVFHSLAEHVSNLLCEVRRGITSDQPLPKQREVREVPAYAILRKNMRVWGKSLCSTCDELAYSSGI